MVYISKGYCYDRDTKIIYEETYIGKHKMDTRYAPLLENGKLCYYDTEAK